MKLQLPSSTHFGFRAFHSFGRPRFCVFTLYKSSDSGFVWLAAATAAAAAQKVHDLLIKPVPFTKLLQVKKTGNHCYCLVHIIKFTILVHLSLIVHRLHLVNVRIKFSCRK